jgi:hypothetical protein
MQGFLMRACAAVTAGVAVVRVWPMAGAVSSHVAGVELEGAGGVRWCDRWLAPGLKVQAARKPPALAGLSVFSALLSPVRSGPNWDCAQSACSVNQAQAANGGVVAGDADHPAGDRRLGAAP